MEWFSKEYSRSSFTLAFILLSAWGVTSFGHAYGRRLKANESFTKGFMAVARLDVIVDALDHLAVNQQAFLSTGDDSFQDDVVVSVETLELNSDMLNSLAVKDTLQRALPVQLSRSIKQVIANVSESDRIRETDNRAAAVDFFASKGDDVSRAKWQAEKLRIAIIRSIAGRIWSANSGNILVERCLTDLFGNKDIETITSSVGGFRGEPPSKNRAVTSEQQ